MDACCTFSKVVIDIGVWVLDKILIVDLDLALQLTI